MQPDGGSGTSSTLAEIGSTTSLDLIGLADAFGGNHAILIDNAVIQPPMFVGDYFPAASFFGTIASPNWLTQSTFGGLAGNSLAPNVNAQQLTAQGQSFGVFNTEAMTAGADAKIWRWVAQSDGTLHYQACNDTYSGCNDIMIMSRSGYVPSKITIPVPVVAGGSAPTASGTCAINTQVGGNTAGSFKFNGACSSAGTVILTFATAAPNGWACDVTDMTTPADPLVQTAYSTTTATIKATAGASSADQTVFDCTAF